MTTQILSIDLGYGFTKGLTPGKPRFICPSLVSPARDIRFKSPLGGDDGITIRIGKDGPAFFVGEKSALQGRGGAQTLSHDRIGTQEQMALFYAACSELVKTATNNVIVVTGLPVADFDKASRAKLIQSLCKPHTVVRDGRKMRRFNVSRVVVLPQAVGCLYGMVLDKRGRITQNHDLQAGRVGVIDVGQLTVNYTTMDGLVYIDVLSESQEAGVSRALTDIQRDLRDECGLSLEKLSLVDAAVRRGNVTVRGKNINIRALTARHIDSLANDVLIRARSLWDTGADLTAVVLTGGGAYLLTDHLRQVYPHLRVDDDAQFGNARGYLRMAVRELGDDY